MPTEGGFARVRERRFRRALAHHLAVSTTDWPNRHAPDRSPRRLSEPDARKLAADVGSANLWLSLTSVE